MAQIIKPDPEGPIIKPDPDGLTIDSSPGDDDDIYEHTEDLEFRNRDPATGETNMNDKMFLVKLPKYLWESWSQIDDDEEIQIGTIRQWHEDKTVYEGHGRNRREVKTKVAKFRMLLKTDQTQQQNIPREYDLDLTDPELTNTFMFSEQDLPSHKLKNKIKAEQHRAGIPQQLIRTSWAAQTDSTPQDAKPAPAPTNKWDRRSKRYTPYYKKAVPKKTIVEGQFRHELNCAPVNNEEARQILRDRVRDATEPKRTMGLLKMHETTGSAVIHTGSTEAVNKFSSFIKSTEKEPTKAKKQEMKAARVTEGELQDMFSQLFKQHSYWSMSSLRAATNQPEAFLRQNLESMGELVRSGTFANKWTLKSEYKTLMQIAETGTSAPEISLNAWGGDDDDEMGGVLPPQVN